MVSWSKKFRDILMQAMIEQGKVLGGPGKTVEIDESKFGKRKYHRGKALDGQWVVGLLERESGATVMIPVEKRDAATLISIIKRWVAPETTILTDCWRGYNSLSSEGYIHQTVNHSLFFKDPITGVNTNRIESSWRASKVAYNSSGRRKKFFAGYLAKYMFCKECRILKVDPFVHFLHKCVDILKSPFSTENSNESEEEDEPEEFTDDEDIE
jgi:transposase-like protein